MSEKSEGLRPARLAATALAGVTGAFLASQLGVYGTVIGAGLLSLLSTVGTEFYVRSLDRTKDAALRSKAMVPRSAEVPRQRQGEQSAGGERPSRPPATSSPPRTTVWPVPAAPATRTARWPAPSVGPDVRTARWATAGNRTAGSSESPQGQPTMPWPTEADLAARHVPVDEPSVGDQRTRYVSLAAVWPDRDIDVYPRRRRRLVDPATVAIDTGDQPSGADAGETVDDDVDSERKRKRMTWPVVAGVSLLGFVLALLAVTGFETLTGKAISGDDRTTVSGMFNGGASADTGAENVDDEQEPVPPSPEEPTEHGGAVVPDEEATQPPAHEPTDEQVPQQEQPQQPEPQQPEEEQPEPVEPGADEQQVPDEGDGQEPAPQEPPQQQVPAEG